MKPVIELIVSSQPPRMTSASPSAATVSSSRRGLRKVERTPSPIVTGIHAVSRCAHACVRLISRCPITSSGVNREAWSAGRSEKSITIAITPAATASQRSG